MHRIILILIILFVLFQMVYSLKLNETNLNCTDYFLLEKNKNISRLTVPFSCVKYPTGLEVFLGIVLTLIVVGSIGGNFLVILAVFLVQKLRTPSNILIVNLATSDFLVSIIVMPIMVYNQLKRYRWPFGELFCDIYISFDVILCTSSILNLCAISIDRYLVITKPMEYTRRRTNGLMAVMIGSAWTVSILVTIPAAIGWKQPFEDGVCQYSNSLGYQIYATLGAFYIPLVIMLVLYYRIFKLARRMAIEDNKRMIGMTQFTTTDDDGDTNEQHNNNNNDNHNFDDNNKSRKSSSTAQNIDNHNIRIITDDENKPLKTNFESSGVRKSDESGTSGFNVKSMLSRRKKSKQNKKSKSNNDSKAIRTLGVIMGCFTLCWLPFFIIQIIKPVLLLANIDPDLYLLPWLFDLFVWLGYINSFLNPIIYAKFNREFRNPFKEILMCHCGSINRRLRCGAYAAQHGLLNQGAAAAAGPHQGHGSGGRGSGTVNLTVGGTDPSHNHNNSRLRRKSSDPFTAVSRKNRLAVNSGSRAERQSSPVPPNM